MSRIKIGVIGAGAWGRNHVRTIAGLGDAELAGVCDLAEPARRAVARQYPGTFITESAADLLERVDAVVIATSAASHAALALEAIERGRAVLVEKPFALTVEDAERVAVAATGHEVPVLVGHLLLFHPAVERLKALVDAGDLGEVYYLYSQRVNLGQVRPDENALWSFGPHDVSMALHLLGETPVQLTATGRSYLQQGIEDVVFLTLEFASGVLAHVQMSWLDPHKERRLTVVGSNKMVVFDDMQPREKLKIYDRGIERPPEYASYGESLTIREGDISIPRIPNVEPLAAELQHFVKVARREVPPRVAPEDGVAVIRVLEAAQESLRQRGALLAIA